MEKNLRKRQQVWERTPKDQAEYVLLELADLWERVTTENVQDFLEKVVEPAFEDDCNNISALVAELRCTEDPSLKKSLNYLLGVHFACEYAVTALASDDDLAWALACEASHWLGMLKGTLLGFGLEAVDGIKTRSDMGSAGGKGRGARYEPLRKRARALTQGKKFKSRRNAVMSITPEIIALSKEIGVPLSESQAPITIDGWLKDMGFTGKRST